MLRLTGFVTSAALAVQEKAPVAVIEIPIPPPEWTLLQREVLGAQLRALDGFAAKYIDSCGYLLSMPRYAYYNPGTALGVMGRRATEPPSKGCFRPCQQVWRPVAGL